ncbi:MAG: hypothetical protein ACRC6I_03540, partial [Paracoccaceae bacterium]
MSKDITFEQARGSLGSLLLLWARIERTARAEVTDAHGGSLPKSAYGIAATLNAWKKVVVAREPTGSLRGSLASALRAQLQQPLDMRNGVCHGLIGISAAYDGMPAALTWELNGIEHGIEWDDLQASFSWLSKVPFAISIISNFPMERPGSRLIDSPENREWWQAEYG